MQAMEAMKVLALGFSVGMKGWRSDGVSETERWGSDRSVVADGW